MGAQGKVSDGANGQPCGPACGGRARTDGTTGESLEEGQQVRGALPRRGPHKVHSEATGPGGWSDVEPSLEWNGSAKSKESF